MKLEIIRTSETDFYLRTNTGSWELRIKSNRNYIHAVVRVNSELFLIRTRLESDKRKIERVWTLPPTIQTKYCDYGFVDLQHQTAEYYNEIDAALWAALPKPWLDLDYLIGARKK